ncbi:hypothetical protein ABGB18_48600 [Nonomuraea sp. B12E4]|uniref:hypothetical protein n=1 Tax=Nonomuraea sp. B12E4 TaxID=3153564 RepID=UPI00325E6658
MEVLDQRGLLDRFHGRRIPGVHFSALPLDLSDIPMRQPYVLVISQSEVERLLRELHQIGPVLLYRLPVDDVAAVLAERWFSGFDQSRDCVYFSGYVLAAAPQAGEVGGRAWSWRFRGSRRWTVGRPCVGG